MQRLFGAGSEVSSGTEGEGRLGACRDDLYACLPLARGGALCGVLLTGVWRRRAGGVVAGEGRAFFEASYVSTGTETTGDKDSFLFPSMRTVSFGRAGSSVVDCDGVGVECVVFPDVRSSIFVCTTGDNHIRLLGGPVLGASGFGLDRGGVITPEHCLKVVFVVICSQL